MAEPSTEWLWILSDVIVNTYWFFWFLLIFQIPCTITSAWPTWCLLMSNKCSPALLFSSTTYCYIRTWILAPGFMLLSFILLSTYVLVTNKHFYCRYMEFSVHSCSSFPSAISEYLMLHTNRRRRDLPEVSTPPIITWPLLTTPMYYFHSNLMQGIVFVIVWIRECPDLLTYKVLFDPLLYERRYHRFSSTFSIFSNLFFFSRHNSSTPLPVTNPLRTTSAD